MTLSLGELAEFLSADLRGDAGYLITGIAALGHAESHQVSFLASAGYRKLLAQTRAGAVLLKAEDAAGYEGNALVVTDPYLAYARLTRLFDRSFEQAPGIHPSAVVAEDARIAPSARIGPHAVIGAGVEIAEDVMVGPGSSVGARSRIGARTRLAANVSIYHDIVIGEDCLLHSNSVIGADGFGFAPDRERGGWCKIHQLGGVRIGHRVEIGAGTAVDRGALGNTEIGDGVIIDNHVHIAHNCSIGENTAIAAHCGIAGSTRIGRNCTLAGAVGVTGHIEITDNVHFSGMTMVTKSVTEPGSYSSGTAAIDTRAWRKNAVRFNQLNELANRIRQLEKQLNDRK